MIIVSVISQREGAVGGCESGSGPAAVHQQWAGEWSACLPKQGGWVTCLYPETFR